MPGSGVTDDPVAMTIFFARTVRSPTLTVSALSKLAWPLSHSTLFFLNRNSTPWVRPFTASLRLPCMVSRSSSTLPGFTPHFASVPCAASSNSSDAWSNALDGMQPTLRQVPPKRLAALGAGGLEAQAARRGSRRHSRRGRRRSRGRRNRNSQPCSSSVILAKAGIPLFFQGNIVSGTPALRGSDELEVDQESASGPRSLP